MQLQCLTQDRPRCCCSPLPGKAAQPTSEATPEPEHHTFPDLDLLAAAAEELPPVAVPGTGGVAAGAGSGVRLPRTRPLSELQGEVAPGEWQQLERCSIGLVARGGGGSAGQSAFWRPQYWQ